MHLQVVDWLILIAFFAITLALGIWSSKRSGGGVSDYFLSGRDMPWWLLGVSMVATTFSADTPNLVTELVRQDGVAGNWAWWAFLLTGMTTVFLYAKLWRRSGVLTDMEFYEIRYSGRMSAWLRGFRAIYLGVFFNVIIMANVLLAGSKIAGVLLGIPQWMTIGIICVVTLIYAAIGGLRGIVLTDFFQFILGMVGMIGATIYILNLDQIGGLSGLWGHAEILAVRPMIPDINHWETIVPILIIPLAVQWWSVWYPGAEPGGGGYIAQRMLAARNESEAVKATLLFNIAHYALRPWPWILIALASMIIFPTVQDIEVAFPHLSPNLLGDDLAFPAMMTLLPQGLLGLVIAALTAALMSTISTHLNWGASYVTYDVYQRFVHPDASQSYLVKLGRWTTALLMLLAGVVSYWIQSAGDAFFLLLQIGAGTGLLFLLRWFWWRINAYSEIAAMVISLIVAVILHGAWADEIPTHMKLVYGVLVTTIGWLIVTFLTNPVDFETLSKFYRLVRPASFGWQPVINSMTEPIRSDDKSMAKSILMIFIGCCLIYSLLFGTGCLLYGQYVLAVLGFILSLLCMLMMKRWWHQVV